MMQNMFKCIHLHFFNSKSRSQYKQCLSTATLLNRHYIFYYTFKVLISKNVITLDFLKMILKKFLSKNSTLHCGLTLPLKITTLTNLNIHYLRLVSLKYSFSAPFKIVKDFLPYNLIFFLRMKCIITFKERNFMIMNKRSCT